MEHLVCALDPGSDNNTTEIQVDEDSFKPTTGEGLYLEIIRRLTRE